MELCLEMERPSSCKCVLVDDYAWKTKDQDQEGILQKTHSKQ